MEICFSFKSFTGGICGFSYREDRGCVSQVVSLHSFKKDISSHSRSCKFSDPENEVDLILSLAGIFETLTGIDNFKICPTHRCWVELWFQCRVPKEVSGYCNMVRLSRFQKPIGKLASVYHRLYSRCLENSYSLAPVSRLLTTVRKITCPLRLKSRLGIGQ